MNAEEIETLAQALARQTIVDEIFAIRIRNNAPWQRLMEIAMRHAPEETKEALRQINENDREVSALMEALSR